MGIIKLVTHVLFPGKYDKVHYKTGRSKRQKCNDRHFVNFDVGPKPIVSAP